MKVLVIETVTQRAVLDVPGGLTGDRLKRAVREAKEAHDESGTGVYEQVKTIGWDWEVVEDEHHKSHSRH